jgi:hypothetical protein
MIRTAVTWRIRWKPHGAGLDWGPWGVGEANELTLRPNPANRNATIYRYHQVPLAGKRYESIKSFDWSSFVEDISKLAVNASQAKTPPPGAYRAVMDNELIGLLLHELLDTLQRGTWLCTEPLCSAEGLVRELQET